MDAGTWHWSRRGSRAPSRLQADGSAAAGGNRAMKADEPAASSSRSRTSKVEGRRTARQIYVDGKPVGEPFE